MGQLVATGYSTTIVQALRKLLPEQEQIIEVGRAEDATIQLDFSDYDAQEICAHFPAEADRYVLAAGLLTPTRLINQTPVQISQSLAVNCISTVQICEHVLTTNPRARIVVLGSESGEKGSFDTSYFLAKAALHAYVRERALSSPNQQLVCVAPSTIDDSGMTQRRSDVGNLASIKQGLPKQRFLQAQEVARLIHYLLYVDTGYISNEVINMNGGKFARMRVDN